MILVFLLSVRSTLVTAVSIPTSVLITFIALRAAGYSLNILTLGALTIAIGRVVDDSIVVIENIKRHLGTARTSARRSLAGGEGGGRRGHRVDAHDGRRVPPIAFVGGIAGELFRPFALTVTIALLASLLVVADDRPGAGVLVPQARQARRRRGRAPRSTPRRRGDGAARAAARVPAGHPLDPAAPWITVVPGRARARRHDRAGAAA